MRQTHNAQLTRVNKAVARKRFEAGRTTFVIQCRVAPVLPGSGWVFIRPVEFSKATMPGNNYSFDSFVNEFEFYNCNSELGAYAAFYVMKGE